MADPKTPAEAPEGKVGSRIIIQFVLFLRPRSYFWVGDGGGVVVPEFPGLYP